MNECPDKWIMLEFENGTRKILAGWNGSYLGSSFWRLNSGVKSFEVKDYGFDFHGHSGSVYKCKSERYGTNGVMNVFLNQRADRMPNLKILTLEEVCQLTN